MLRREYNMIIYLKSKYYGFFRTTSTLPRRGTVKGLDRLYRIELWHYYLITTYIYYIFIAFMIILSNEELWIWNQCGWRACETVMEIHGTELQDFNVKFLLFPRGKPHQQSLKDYQRCCRGWRVTRRYAWQKKGGLRQQN